jgi:hypothetical protein
MKTTLLTIALIGAASFASFPVDAQSSGSSGAGGGPSSGGVSTPGASGGASSNVGGASTGTTTGPTFPLTPNGPGAVNGINTPPVTGGPTGGTSPGPTTR